MVGRRMRYHVPRLSGGSANATSVPLALYFRLGRLSCQRWRSLQELQRLLFSSRPVTDDCEILGNLSRFLVAFLSRQLGVLYLLADTLHSGSANQLARPSTSNYHEYTAPIPLSLSFPPELNTTSTYQTLSVQICVQDKLVIPIFKFEIRLTLRLLFKVYWSNGLVLLRSKTCVPLREFASTEASATFL